jgi:hypothetical protein
MDSPGRPPIERILGMRATTGPEEEPVISNFVVRILLSEFCCQTGVRLCESATAARRSNFAKSHSRLTPNLDAESPDAESRMRRLWFGNPQISLTVTLAAFSKSAAVWLTAQTLHSCLLPVNYPCFLIFFL